MSVPFRGRKRLVLQSPLSPGMCVTRLTSALSSGSIGVAGHVAGLSVRLRKRIAYYNSFQTLLRGTLHASNGGTRFDGQLGVHPLVSAFFALALGFMLLLGGLHIFGALRSMPFDRVLPQIVGIGTIFLAAFVVPFFGRYIARGEERLIVDFFRQTLDAREDI